ncbi:DedA family protein [Bacillus sp. T33-2]|uniref:DedA family protein n=1 Tax=Bacillus sp. T33-2 TaxID=2054168 RepID=UPI000C793246|nr:DedA family protein [Bacillus sp. T33-2]PLR92546.1 alkaline phosphatase [Bacillus sp. T33-2]
MDNWIIETIEQFGYMGIFLLITLENLFPPIPSEVILTFGGFLTTTTTLSVIGVITFSTFGSVAGAVVLYRIGMLLDVTKLEKIIGSWGHILRLTNKDLHKTNAWFSKYGAWTVFFCRFIPLIRSLISIPAGMARMNFGLFVLYTTLGTLIWNVALVNVGAMVGGSWDGIVGYMDIYATVVYAAGALLLVLLAVMFIKKRKN